MAVASFRIREVRLMVDYPTHELGGATGMVYGVRNRVRILNAVSAGTNVSNGINNNGPLYLGIAASSAGTNATVTVRACVYTNAERTLAEEILLQRPSSNSTTSVLSLSAGASYQQATFANAPIVAPYGIKVELLHGSASAGTVSADLIVEESEHGTSRG